VFDYIGEKPKAQGDFEMNAGMLLNERQATKVLGVAVQTLRNWRCLRVGPPYVKIGRRVFYLMDDLKHYVNAHRIIPRGTAEPEVRDGCK